MLFTDTYHPGLVALSITIAVVFACLALEFWTKTDATPRRRHTFAAVTMGVGVWAMHFTAMLAYRMPFEVSYDVTVTILSLLIAVAGASYAFFIASRGQIGFYSWLGAGLVMGLAISSMHYVGMAAMNSPATIYYEPGLVTLSVMIGVGISLAALLVIFRFQKMPEDVPRHHKFISGLVLGVAVPGMHFSAMAATDFRTGLVNSDGLYPPLSDAVAVAGDPKYTFVV